MKSAGLTDSRRRGRGRTTGAGALGHWMGEAGRVVSGKWSRWLRTAAKGYPAIRRRGCCTPVTGGGLASEVVHLAVGGGAGIEWGREVIFRTLRANGLGMARPYMMGRVAWARQSEASAWVGSARMCEGRRDPPGVVCWRSGRPIAVLAPARERASGRTASHDRWAPARQSEKRSAACAPVMTVEAGA